MKRREFTLLLGAAAAWPLAARAQDSAPPVVAVLTSQVPGERALRLVEAVREGLAAGGYEQGRNVAVEPYFADASRMLSLAAVLASRKVTAMVAIGNVAAIASKAATNSVPVVFQIGA